MANTTKVHVTKATGEEVTVSYNGDEPVTYKVKDGVVSVDNAHLEKFLGIVEGSKASGGDAAVSTTKGE